MRAIPRLAETLVLACGVLSALGLLWAGTRSWGDPESLARIEVERGAERGAQLMQLAWQRRAAAPTAPLGGPIWRAELTDLAPRPPAPELAADSAGINDQAFRALFARAESTHDRSLVESALERYPEASGRPEALLRSIQLAVGDGDAAAAAVAWQRARAELEPESARGDMAYLLLAALAAAPAMDDAARAQAQQELVSAWQAGRLKLPTPQDQWKAADDGPGAVQLDPRFEVWAKAIEGLSPVHAAAARQAARRDGRGLRALWKALEEPTPPPADGHWHPLGNTRWLARADPEGGLALTPYDAAALAASIEHEARPGDGFSLAGPGPQSASSVRIAGRDWPLFQPGLPDEVAHQAARQRNLRLGFGLLFVLTLAATGLTFAALRRRRRLDQLKTRFIAGVSHDLRTPLASILIMAENLESERVTDKPRQAEYHRSIRREATRLGRLVDDVLDFSRLERGERPQLNIEDVRLAEFAGLLESECAERVALASAELTIHRGELPASAALDPSALRRAILNLLDNALTHSGSQELELSIDATDNMLRIEVADHGRGIPAAQRQLLFEPFRQGNRANPSAGGAGLGLSIVRELARAHGGEADFVEPQPGASSGTRVRFSIPLEAPPGAPT